MRNILLRCAKRFFIWFQCSSGSSCHLVTSYNTFGWGTNKW